MASFERILASLHAAVFDDQLWPTASALIDEACGIEGNALLVGAGPSDDVRVLFAQARYRGERRRDLERDYLTDYHPTDERIPRVRKLLDGRIMHISDLYTAEELKTSPTYNEMMPRCSMQDSVNVRLEGLDGSHIVWALGDPVDSSGAWDSSRITMVERLLPHVRQYVGIRQLLAKAGALGAPTSALIDSFRLGVIHLDPHGRIMAANDRARAILGGDAGLRDRGGVLTFQMRKDDPRLQGLIADALPVSAAPAVSGSMVVRRQDGLPLLSVAVKPLAKPDFGVRHVAALVLLDEPVAPRRVNPGLVAKTLGLTQSESEVAVGLAEGKTVRDMAEATGRTTGAIYWHLKAIYMKLGISRQVDLVRLVLPLTELA